jgi:peptide/nickel transport system substrate-binding protein/oligopeptide transport system substrate-binding protein
MKKTSIAFALAFAAVLVFAGGQADKKTDAGADAAAAPAAAKEKVIKMSAGFGGTYMDMMKTIYNRAGMPDLIQIPISAYDKNFDLHPVAAEGWSVSTDGLVWTIKLIDGLVWSDGVPLTANDFVFGLQRAAKGGYDFSWYWSWAGGIKNWGAVEKGEMGVDQLGVKALDARTIQVTTDSPKPYFPGICAYWWAVPKHAVDKYGDEYATKAETMPSSGPFKISKWVLNESIELVKNPSYKGPWAPKIDKVILYPQLGNPEVGFPAYLANDLDVTGVNVGQLSYARQKLPTEIKPNALFQIYYMAFDYATAPFNDVNVRKAFMYAFDREKATSTILKDIAAPAYTLVTPGFSGYNTETKAQTGFDAAKARDFLAKAGFPGGKGFPKIQLLWRIEGGYHAPIVKPMAEYIQAQIKEVLGIELEVKGLELKTWMDSLSKREGKLFISPYMYDYIDASNFYDIFLSGGRHNWSSAKYDELVKKADSISKWEERAPLYRQAEQILVDEATVTYLVHAKENTMFKAKLIGAGVEANKYGNYPLMYPWTVCNLDIKE